MLVLTRRINESIHIGNDVQVTVIGVKGSTVRLGIQAPTEVPVHREEIYKRIEKEKQAGVTSTPTPDEPVRRRSAAGA